MVQTIPLNFNFLSPGIIDSLSTLWARAARSAPSLLPTHSSSLEVTFSSLRLKTSRKFHLKFTSLDPLLSCFGDNRAWAPNEDVSSVILKGCDYTLYFLLFSHCTNILFAAATWLLKHFKHHTEVQDLPFFFFFFLLTTDKPLAYRDKGASQKCYYPKEMSPWFPPSLG